MFLQAMREPYPCAPACQHAPKYHLKIQWDDLNDRSKIYPTTGTKISVKFRIGSEGKIAEIIDVDSNGGSQAANLCKSAVTDRAPYGKWTDDMIAVPGDSQEMTFTFYYGTP